MPQKWNLQDIRPAGTQKSVQKPTATRTAHVDIAPRVKSSAHSEEILDDDLASIRITDGNSSKHKRVITTSIIIVFIVAGAFITNLMLGGADVTVYPKTKSISVQSEINAYTEPQSDDLSYELLTLEASAEKQVKATGKEDVSTHATGKIFVYNTKSTSPQRLITNTRFESPDGLVFRIKDSIEVPGAKTDSAGVVVPGKITAEVYADGPGEQYNILPTRFTIPGLKGSDQYDSVYGESLVQFESGFEGEKYIIEEGELQRAKQELHVELRDSLLKKLSEEKPAGFIIYDDAITFTYVSLPATEYGNSLATIKEKASLQIPMFKENDFASYIAGLTIPDYNNDEVYILDPNALAFSYVDKTVLTSDISDVDSIQFYLKGSSDVVWKFDPEKLKSDLVGIDKNQATAVFANYKAIGHAQAEVRPFWSTSFPDNPKDINIITIIE